MITNKADAMAEIERLLERNRILQSDQKRLEGFAKTYRKTADENGKAAHKAQCDLVELREAVRNLQKVEGRHHTEIACERLYALLPENAKADRS